MSAAIAQYGNQRNHSVTGLTGNAWIASSWRAAMIFIAVTLYTSGCARRAYNDVYVENMAAEIRDLEDQLYEFDGEYRVMEQQLAALKAENARLRGATAPPANARSLRQESSPSPSDASDSDYFVPRGNSNTVPANPSAPSKSAPSPAPSLEIGSPSPSSPPRSNLPTPLPGNSSPSMSPAPSLMPAPLPAPKPAPGADQLNPSDLIPPTIEQGEPMPPTLPPIGTNPSNPVTMHGDNDLELELGQIKIPAQLASSAKGQALDDLTVQSSQIHPAATMPDDTRIVEVKFHPTLCRAVNSDQQGDDDGLYVVLQPYNAAGEFVPLPADLMIVALDLSRDEKQAAIGRWTLSAADVKAKMNPIGSSQGIHLSLSFSGPAPQCDRVLVFAYYTLTDGRRLTDNHEIMLNNLHRQNAGWVPRTKSEVRTASAP